MNITGKSLIAGRFSASGYSTFQGVNPSSQQPVEPAFFEATADEIDEAIQKADTAFQIYQQKSGKEKSEFLLTIGEEILGLGDDLIERAALETGLSTARIANERNRTINQLKMFADLVQDGSWINARIHKMPAGNPSEQHDIRSMEVPLGPVGVFGASNFPLAFSVAGGDTASALAAGCPVIFKAHPAHPGTCELVALAIRSAAIKSDMPEGVFSLLQGKSNAVGLAIVRHPLIRAIGFTGSFGGGMALFHEANKRDEPIPVFAEMGSVNPVFVLPGILQEKREQIAKELVQSVTLGVGQFCTNPGLLFTEDSKTSLVEDMAAEMRKTTAETMLTDAISKNYHQKIEKALETEGVEKAASGTTTEKKGSTGVPFLIMTNMDSFTGNPDLMDEIFGPSTIAISAKGKDQILDAAKRLKGQLTATVYGNQNDLEEYKSLIDILRQKAGRLLINMVPTGVEVCQAMIHGGPFPATTNSQSTSVGTRAIYRFTRPLCFQGFPEFLLPPELRDDNPLQIHQRID